MTCHDCDKPMIRGTRPLPAGHVRHRGRGLCTRCLNRSYYHSRRPDAQPRLMPEDRAEDLQWLVDGGETLDSAVARLGTNVDALWKWCDRHGFLDAYEELASRQRRRDNQYTKGRAA